MLIRKLDLKFVCSFFLSAHKITQDSSLQQSEHFGKDPSEVHFLFMDFVKINALQFPPSLK